MSRFIANPRECSITTDGGMLLTGSAATTNVTYEMHYNVMPYIVPGMLMNIPLHDDDDHRSQEPGSRFLTCGPLWALTANHVKFRRALVRFFRPPRNMVENGRLFEPNQDVYLAWAPASALYFMKIASKRSETVDFIEVGSVVGTVMPVMKPFRFLEAFTIGVWLLLAASVVVLGFFATVSVRRHGRLRCVRSPLLVMLQFVGLFLSQSQKLVTTGSRKRNLRSGVLVVLLLSFIVLMNAFQGSLWTMMGLAFKPLVADSLIDLLNPVYDDWLVLSSKWLPEFYHIKHHPVLMQALQSADRLFLLDWEENLQPAAHLWGALFVGYGHTFAVMPRRFIMHIIWMAWQMGPVWGSDRKQSIETVAALHISEPIAVQPFFILFNGDLRREVTESYAHIFTLYWQSGLIAHWFSLEDSHIEHILTASTTSLKSDSVDDNHYSEPVFEQLHPRDLAGAFLVVLICFLLCALTQILVLIAKQFDLPPPPPKCHK